MDSREDYGEHRFVSLGKIRERLHVMCWTMRGSKMRIISLRKANEREQKIFSDAKRDPSAAH
ncbi:BrnT family toxin [Rhizobium rhizosphaerae]|uniref:BrnT family toxin n=1 Tax=Xaviernesmea rhizosphaerae TaxID=1672749 RepID=UPI001FDA8D84|nr:BrnT family toxin [Xaviernesmea rhizosphaerae]